MQRHGLAVHPTAPVHAGGGSAFQSSFQEQCVQADVAYVPPVVVTTRSRLVQTGDDRKTAKPGKKDDKAKPAADEKIVGSFVDRYFSYNFFSFLSTSRLLLMHKKDDRKNDRC